MLLSSAQGGSCSEASDTKGFSLASHPLLLPLQTFLRLAKFNTMLGQTQITHNSKCISENLQQVWTSFMSHFVFHTHSNVMTLYHPEQAMPSICSGSNCFASCADYRNARKLWLISQTHGCKWDLPASIWKHSNQCSYFLPHSDLPPCTDRLPKKLIQCQQHTVKMEEETVQKSIADNFILTHKTQMQFFIS